MTNRYSAMMMLVALIPVVAILAHCTAAPSSQPDGKSSTSFAAPASSPSASASSSPVPVIPPSTAIAPTPAIVATHPAMNAASQPTTQTATSVTPTPAPIPAVLPAPAGGKQAMRSEWRNATCSNRYGNAAASDAGLLLTTDQFTSNEFNLQIGWRTTAPLKRGQVVLVRFVARSIKSADMTGQTQLGVFFQKSSPDWFKSIHTYVQMDDQWRWFDIPFKVMGDYKAGEASVNLSFGFAPQIAEVANLQLIAYPPGTEITSLPKTQPSPGEVDPATYEQTVARIVDYRKIYAAKLAGDPVATPGRKLHVDARAAGDADGSAQKPFAAIQSAIDAAQPGDTILVAPGTYEQPSKKQNQYHTRIKLKGRPDAWISIRAAPVSVAATAPSTTPATGPTVPRPKIVSSSWKAFELSDADYIEIRGFEFEGIVSPNSKNSSNGIAILDRSTHIRIIDNIVHGFGGGGIYSSHADYVHIEGNVVHHTSHGSDWGNSGISIYQSINSDTAPGYHNVIRRNVVYDNENLKPFKFGGGQITDGNGIILDDNRHTQNKSKEGPYQGWTLIENNLVYGNGGRGIHAYLSDHIDVVNNTVYMNQRSKDIRNGEITAIRADQMSFFNNIVFTHPNARANADDRSTHVVFGRNLIFNTDDLLAGKDAIVGKDPLFSNPSSAPTAPESFRLNPNSPAIGEGLQAVAPSDDLFGNPRSGPIDLGAIQGQSR